MTSSALASFHKTFRLRDLTVCTTDNWVVSVRPGQLTLGSLVASSRFEHVLFSELPSQAGHELLQIIATYEVISRKLFAADKLNCISLMLKDPLVHFHLLPRYSAPVTWNGDIWSDTDWPKPSQFRALETPTPVLTRLVTLLRGELAHLNRIRVSPAADALRASWMTPTFKHYQVANALFEREFGKSLFAIGGTLLGAIRSGGFISHDYDMDVAFLSDSESLDEARKEFVAKICRLLDLGQRITLFNEAGKFLPRHIKWHSNEDDSYVDVMPALFDSSGQYSRPTFVRVPLSRGDILPLREVPFEDGKVWVPNHPEAKLEKIFGPNWRKPDPSWRKPVFDTAEMRSGLAFRPEEIDQIAEHSQGGDKRTLAAYRRKRWPSKIQKRWRALRSPLKSATRLARRFGVK